MAKNVSYILLVKKLGHFRIVADSLILENQETRVERIITMRIFEACYLSLDVIFFLFRSIKPKLFFVSEKQSLKN